MGRRGPRPTPTAILKLRGSSLVPSRKNEPVPDPATPECPDWISDEAKQAWAQVVPQLEDMGVLGRIDGNALARYCQLWARWKVAEQFIQKYGSTYKLKDSEGNTRCFMQFPEISIAHRLATQLAKLEAEFGMTPSSRSRISVETKKAVAQNKRRYFEDGA